MHEGQFADCCMRLVKMAEKKLSEGASKNEEESGRFRKRRSELLVAVMYLQQLRTGSSTQP